MISIKQKARESAEIFIYEAREMLMNIKLIEDLETPHIGNTEEEEAAYIILEAVAELVDMLHQYVGAMESVQEKLIMEIKKAKVRRN